VRFQIVTVAEKAGEKKVLARSTIDGLPGTDFNINLQTDNFKMEARFINDLLSDEKLRTRAKLQTRRFYGTSPHNLPLYEEDMQQQTLDLSFSQKIILVPFGRNGGEETLKIEITPILFTSDVGDKEPIKITFDKELASKEIFIGASKIPHNFEVEANVYEDGKLLARGVETCLIEEEKEITLKSLDGSESFKTSITVNKFERNRPRDLVGIRFSLFRGPTTILAKSAGMSLLEDELAYLLDNPQFPKGKKYELKLKIRLSDKEK